MTLHGLPTERLLQDWQAAHLRALAYLEALEVATEERPGLAAAAVERALSRPSWAAGSDAVGETLRAVREILPERLPRPVVHDARGDAFLAWRLAGLLGGTAGAAAGAGRLGATPPITRGSMVPDRIERRFLRRLLERRAEARGHDAHPAARPAPAGEGSALGASGGRGASGASGEFGAADPVAAKTAELRFGRALRERRRTFDWTRAAYRRRWLLGVLVLLPSVVASGFMVNVLPGRGGTWMEATIVLLFGALFGWISIGFWTALLGFLLLVGKRDRFAITGPGERVEVSEAARALSPEARTAIVMPICEEPVERVFAGLEAIHRSLERAGALEPFHFFVLSDSSDPSTAVREEEAWASLCRRVGGFGRIFYRRRKVRLKRKSGNVADFCRRFGRRYRYMIMLDADSVMTAESLVHLVDRMEAHPEVGLIQTAPVAVNRRSLLARVQQFATQVYGPMFCAGLHFWQLGDAQYWGHNAILRVAPFMRHCGLPCLPGKPPLGGMIMSHDFVEAALLGRSGWTIWLAYDLPGSYEEVPSTLLEEMGRDRRWCQGNLQHLRLLFSEGLFGAHRALFVNGVLSYVSALLWLAFLLLSTGEAIRHALVEPDYFPDGPSLFPQWPIWRPDWAMWLLAVTGAILFLPKLLAIALVAWKRRGARCHGGLIRLACSVVLEVLLSSMLAPIRMVFHSRFVVTNLLGRTVTWRSQGREDAETGWGEAIRQHGFDTLFASAWAGLLYWLNPDYFWWVMPIIGALLLSIPLSVLTSRTAAGQWALRRRLFLIPEEVARPPELRDLHELAAAAQADLARLPAAERDGFVRAAVAPAANALHRGLLGRPRSLAPAIRAARAALLERLLESGPAALSGRERRIVLCDPAVVDELHRRVWQLRDPEERQSWLGAGRD